jgi:hypothetical protein
MKMSILRFLKLFALQATMVVLIALSRCSASPAQIQEPAAGQHNTHEHQTHQDGHAHDLPSAGKSLPEQGDQKTESDATHAMQHHHTDSPHMRLTALRALSPGDRERADKIVATLRDSLEPYRDYRVALAQGYRIFMPKVPQREYHFNSYWNGFLEAFTFDPSRPTSLLYRKTPGGYELVGAMFTAPKRATLEQLNERVPLSVVRWHAHTNLCMPKEGGNTRTDWKKFGLTGSISTKDDCAAAGGRFFPQVFGWMAHVYPFESSPDKVWVH